MFYAHFVLSKKGPLARIWLAAHWDKKLTRAHVFETNISSSVEAILEPKLKMALRTSGHLLLGVVRIYSRKAKYLLADCNEAFVKIKMAFRPGVVDLPDDVNREAAISAITLPENLPDFEATIADLNEINMNAITINQSRPEDITMREDFGEINLGRQDDDFGDSAFDESVSREAIREGDKTFGDGIYPTAGSLSIRSGGDDFSLQHDATLIGGRSVESRKQDKYGGLSARPDDIGIDDNDFGDGFLGAPDDDDENFGGEIDHSLFADAGIFEDPSAQKQLEHLTSEIASHMDTVNLGLALGAGDLEPPGTVGTDRSTDSAMNVDGKSPEPFANTAVENTLDAGHTSNTFLTRVAASAAAGGHGGIPASGATTIQDTQSTTLLTNESEAFALPPIDTTAVTGMEPKRATKRKRRLIIDEQKSIPSEIMKLQMDDTSDITTQLDLAPPTKKLMHWKETGSVDKLFTLPGRTIPSRILQRLFMRNLQTMSVPDDVLEAQQYTISSLRPGMPARIGRGSVVQEEFPSDDVAAIDISNKTTAASGHDLSSSHSPSLALQMTKVVPQSANAKLDAIREEVSEELSAKNTHSDIEQVPSAPLDDDDDNDDFGCHEIDDDLAFMGEPETPYIAPPSVLSEAPHSVMQADMFALEQELAAADDEAEHELAAAFHAAASANAASGGIGGDLNVMSANDGALVGPGGVSVMESLEERKLEKRSKVLLRMLGAYQRQHGWNEPLSLHSICGGNTKKQAASKFYTILLLRKQGAVELFQPDAYSDILVSRGTNFSRLVEV